MRVRSDAYSIRQRLLPQTRRNPRKILLAHVTHTPSAYTKPRLPSSCTRRKIRWDPKKEEIIGDVAATEMLSPKYREPWKLSV